MAEPDTLPPDPFASEKPLHRRMLHKPIPGDLTKAGFVAWLAGLGAVFLTLGVAFLTSSAWALVVWGALLLVGAVAAYRTLEDE